jgi:hypothetical protein
MTLTTAARALALSQSEVDCFDDLEPEAQAALVENVRAVLGAIREPSRLMEANGANEIPYHDSTDREMRAVTCFQAMLDTALSE